MFFSNTTLCPSSRFAVRVSRKLHVQELKENSMADTRQWRPVLPLSCLFRVRKGVFPVPPFWRLTPHTCWCSTNELLPEAADGPPAATTIKEKEIYNQRYGDHPIALSHGRRPKDPRIDIRSHLIFTESTFFSRCIHLR